MIIKGKRKRDRNFYQGNKRPKNGKAKGTTLREKKEIIIRQQAQTQS